MLTYERNPIYSISINNFAKIFLISGSFKSKVNVSLKKYVTCLSIPAFFIDLWFYVNWHSCYVNFYYLNAIFSLLNLYLATIISKFYIISGEPRHLEGYWPPQDHYGGGVQEVLPGWQHQRLCGTCLGPVPGWWV